MNALRDFLRIGVNPPNAVGALPASADNLLPLQINNVGRVLMTDGQRAYWGDLPAGGIAIGDPVTDGTAQQALFVDSNGDLAQADGVANDFKYTPGAAASTFLLHQFADGDPVAGTLTLTHFVDTNGSQLSKSEFKHQTLITGECLTTLDMVAIDEDGVFNSFKVNVGTLAANVKLDWTADDVTYANAITLAGTGVVPTVDINGILSVDNAVAAGAALVSTHKMRINIGGADYDVMLVAV